MTPLGIMLGLLICAVLLYIVLEGICGEVQKKNYLQIIDPKKEETNETTAEACRD